MARSKDLADLSEAYLALDLLKVNTRNDAAMLRAGWRARERWIERTSHSFEQWLKPSNEVDLVPAIELAQDMWSKVGKARSGDPDPSRLDRLLRRIFGGIRALAGGGVAVYLGLAREVSEESGQHTLDTLGLNQTFRWTTPRDMARDIHAVRGSKVLALAANEHLDRLRDIIIRATDPAKPKAMGEIVAEIEREWSVLRRWQAERIARTETAAVWETTNFNALYLNGVTQVDWVIASGPSIGPPKSYPPCDDCVEIAAQNPWVVTDVELPPKHPNCRCTLVPVYDADWLPPAETWHGQDPPLPLRDVESV